MLKTRFLKNTFSTASQLLKDSLQTSKTWSVSQQSKSKAMSGPRFEQTDFQVQPNPPIAQDLIANVAINFVDARVVACDGGDLGHPKVFLNLDKGKPMSCGYCGLRYQRKDH